VLAEGAARGVLLPPFSPLKLEPYKQRRKYVNGHGTGIVPSKPNIPQPDGEGCLLCL
jgi:hypothetical protein